MTIDNSQIETLRPYAEGLGLDALQFNQLVAHAERVCTTNTQTNLISKSDALRILTRHTLDSLQLVPLLRKSPGFRNGKFTLLDMGSGAGFPVIPLAICFPDATLRAAEPRQKRWAFLQQVVTDLELKNISIHLSRAESGNFPWGEFVTARALGSLQDDWNRARNYLKRKGQFFTFKVREEPTPPGAKTLYHPYELPGEEHPFLVTQMESHD